MTRILTFILLFSLWGCGQADGGPGQPTEVSGAAPLCPVFGCNKPSEFVIPNCHRCPDGHTWHNKSTCVGDILYVPGPGEPFIRFVNIEDF